MGTRLILKPEVLKLQEELRTIKADGDKATKEDKEKLSRMGRMLQLRKSMEVADHVAANYTGKDGAYRIAPASVGDDLTAKIQAIVSDQVGDAAGADEDRVKELIAEAMQAALSEDRVKELIAETAPPLVDKAIEEKLGGSDSTSEQKNAGKQPAK